MKFVPRGIQFVLLSIVGACTAQASFLVDPTGGTVLWGDGARYDDFVVRNRDLGFDFSYFGGDPVSAIDVSTNGNLNFNGDSDYGNERVGTDVVRISPLWDDLEVTAGSGDSIVEKAVAGKFYSVTWRVHEHGSATTKQAFQAVLFGAAMRINGQDFAPGDIVFSYDSVGKTFDKETATVGLDAGDSSTFVPLPGAVALTGLIAHGEAGLLPTGQGGFILFHPDGDTGEYVVSTHLNRPPVAVDDTQYSVGRGRFTIDALANDSDPDGIKPTLESVTQGSFGNVSIADGKIVYTPGPSFVGTDIFTYTVRDPYGLTATARVTVLPFGAGRGTFDGLLLTGPSEDDPDPAATNEGSGYLKLTLTANGSFTGTLNFGGFTRTLKGTFGPQGQFTTAFQRVVDGVTQAVVVTLRLDLANEAAPLTGTVSDGEFTTQLQAARTGFSAKFPTTMAGKYTVLLQPGEDGSGPAGIGYAQMKIAAGGAVSLTGKLGDGRNFSFGGFLKTGKNFPLYLPIKTAQKLRTGSVFGTVAFDSTIPSSDCKAALHWFMPDVGDTSGFEASPQLLGNRYVAPPRGSRVLSLSNVVGNAAIDLGGGQLTEVLTLDSANKVIVQGDGTEGLAVTINATSGLFSGRFFEESFDDPPKKLRRNFGGVLLPKSNLGGGLYLDADKAGAPVLITPPLLIE